MLRFALALPDRLRAATTALLALVIMLATSGPCSAVQVNASRWYNGPEYISTRGCAPSAHLNWYGYSGGDPVNRVDPTGLYWEVTVGMGEALHSSGAIGPQLQSNARWVPWIDGVDEPAGGIPQEAMASALSQLDKSEGRDLIRVYTGEEEAAYLTSVAAHKAGGESGIRFRYDQIGTGLTTWVNEGGAGLVGLGDDLSTALVYYSTGGPFGGKLHDLDMDDSVRSWAAKSAAEYQRETGTTREQVSTSLSILTAPIPVGTTASLAKGAGAMFNAARHGNRLSEAESAARTTAGLTKHLDDALRAPARGAGVAADEARAVAMATKTSRQPAFANLADHAARHSSLPAGRYLEQAIRHLETGKRFAFRHDGQTKSAFITRTGPDSFAFTSATPGRKVIFTHIEEVTEAYLKNIGITLPKGF